MTAAAAQFTRSVTFQSRADNADGDALGAWADVVTRRAKIVPRLAGEAALNARLQGEQPVVISIRRDAVTKTIDNAWRAIDARDPAVVWSISSPPVWNEAENLIELLAVEKRGGSDA